MTYKNTTPVSTASKVGHMGPHDTGSDVEEDLQDTDGHVSGAKSAKNLCFLVREFHLRWRHDDNNLWWLRLKERITSYHTEALLSESFICEVNMTMTSGDCAWKWESQVITLRLSCPKVSSVRYTWQRWFVVIAPERKNLRLTHWGSLIRESHL